MIFDFNMMQTVYAHMGEKINAAKKCIGKALTLTEKIFYAHAYDPPVAKGYQRGSAYVHFSPDRVAMQDATAQMALLQFIQAGKNKTAVPTTVHCDHLIQAATGAHQEFKKCLEYPQRSV